MQRETRRLTLRGWTDADRAPMAAIQGDSAVRQFFYRTATPEQVNADIDLAMERWRSGGFHFFAAELKATGRLIGLIGLGEISDLVRSAIPGGPEVEIGWVLDKQVWGQGLAVEGALESLRYAWSRGIPEVVAFTARLNLPSQRVMQKLGMNHDPAGDFRNPRIPPDHPLSEHVVYRIRRP